MNPKADYMAALVEQYREWRLAGRDGEEPDWVSPGAGTDGLGGAEGPQLG